MSFKILAYGVTPNECILNDFVTIIKKNLIINKYISLVQNFFIKLLLGMRNGL